MADQPPETTDVPWPPQPDEGEYDAFEGLTRKLLTVTKKDLDDARAREQATDPGR